MKKSPTSETISLSQSKGHLRDAIEEMSDTEAINLWNNVIVKNAPNTALKATLDKKLPPPKKK